MNDTIIGVAVLQPIWVPGIYRLWFTAQKSVGTVNQGNIFIRDGSLPGPDTVPNYPNEHVWKFIRAGQKLNCSPSVNWISWGFHNAAAWSVDYVEMVETEPEGGASAGYWGSKVHRNLEFISAASRTELIADLTAKGVLKVR